MMPELSHGFCETPGARLHFAEAGAGPLVVLLHGFPEFWYAFRSQIPVLGGAGFHVVAPDLRGYNLSSKPHGIGAYVMTELVEDVAALIRSRGETRACVIGHDWGGGIAWAFGMRHPEMLERLVVMNCPHPAHFAGRLPTLRQLAKSWYIGFFQLPWLPEFVLSRGGYRLLIESIQNELQVPSAFGPAERSAYMEAYAHDAALTSMLNYYRALRSREGGVPLEPITAEVLVLWGALDRHLELQLARPAPRWVPNARLEILHEASHWLHHEFPQRVNARLIAFLTAGLAGVGGRNVE
jgi:epoxide hydrolase 4